MLPAFLHRGRRRAARRTPSATYGASLSRSTPRRATGTWSATTPRCSSCATPTSSRTSSTPRSGTPGPICATRRRCGTSGPSLRRACTQITILMSDRGVPKSYRHMNGYGSHTFSLVNDENERFWVKFHFKTMQGVECLSDEGGRGHHRHRSRESSAGPVRLDRAPQLSEMALLRAGHAGGGCGEDALQPLRPDQGLAAPRLSADRGRPSWS